jgi:hypothetical protein
MWDWCCINGVGVQMEARVSLFLLTKDHDGVLELREPCSLFVYMLHSGFGTLDCGLPTSDSFLFLMMALNLLLNPG